MLMEIFSTVNMSKYNKDIGLLQLNLAAGQKIDTVCKIPAS